MEPEGGQSFRRASWATVSLGLAGVVLPFLALGVELGTRICTGVYVDPLPSAIHIVLVTLVACTNLTTWRRVRRGAPGDPRLLLLFNGATLGVSAFYTLLFLPLMPLSLAAFMFWGIGFLIWAPFGALFQAFWDRRALLALCPPDRVGSQPRFWKPALAALLLLSVADLPAVLTQVGLNLVSSDHPSQVRRGLDLLRAVGDREELLRRCHWHTSSHLNPLALVARWLSPQVYPHEVRGIFYRVTGKSFDQYPRPSGDSFFEGNREDQWDFSQGGTTVGPKLLGLSLGESRIQGSVDAQAALAYLEWTLVLENSWRRDREARMEIQLPSGAVVSRVTLWVNGEPREAAFAARDQARRAYQSVVQTQRDPLLVTTSGTDGVLAQCFPVPSQGKMKIRLGITTPLALPAPEQALLILPRLRSSNFALPDDFPHHIQVAAGSPLAPVPYHHPRPQPAGWLQGQESTSTPAGDLLLGVMAARPDSPHLVGGQVPNWALGEPVAYLAASRDPDPVVSWCQDSRAEPASVVRQEISFAPLDLPRSVILVVDGSASMKLPAGELARVLEELPEGLEVGLTFASQETEDRDQELARRDRGGLAELAETIRSFPYAGGQENAPALARVAAHCGKLGRETLVLWLHGPQPLESPPLPFPLTGPRGNRTPPSVRVMDLQLAPGQNRLSPELGEFLWIPEPPFLGSASRDLALLAAAFQGRAQGARLDRQRVPTGSVVTGHQTSDHLARLLVRQEILETRVGSPQRAITLAHRYQLVTPVSGAVVLENQAQYEANDLRPAAEDSVPVIPEPGTWLMLLLAVTGLTWFQRRPCQLPEA